MMTKEISPRLLFSGTLLALAAVFFLIPGLLTDLLAIMLLTPMMRAGLFRAFGPHFKEGVEDYQRRNKPHKPHDSTVIEGEFTRLDTK